MKSNPLIAELIYQNLSTKWLINRRTAVKGLYIYIYKTQLTQHHFE